MHTITFDMRVKSINIAGWQIWYSEINDFLEKLRKLRLCEFVSVGAHIRGANLHWVEVFDLITFVRMHFWS